MCKIRVEIIICVIGHLLTIHSLLLKLHSPTGRICILNAQTYFEAEGDSFFLTSSNLHALYSQGYNRIEFMELGLFANSIY